AIPEPLPGAPPALIRASGPLMAMPLGSRRGELPAAFANLVRQDYPRLQRYGLDPALYDKAGGGERPLLWVVDPHGNLVLRYDAKANGKKLLKDVQLLLKLSHIG
ncbi:hypothetical protein LZK55_16590, partial [Pseudomonas aeruginosa]|nr:hypothetical protein [Pseudomonas aeruginosa]